MDNNFDKEAKTSDKFRMLFLVILLLLLTVPVIFVCYDKFINKETPPIPTPTISPEPTETTLIVDDKITSFERIEITDTNKIVNVGGKEFTIKQELTVDGAYLYINDVVQVPTDNETIYADIAYVTNKYIIFTNPGQDGEIISYAIDKDGKPITVNDNDDQMHDIVLLKDNLEASGHIFCGLDGDCPDKTLIIKYESDTIKVLPKE